MNPLGPEYSDELSVKPIVNRLMQFCAQAQYNSPPEYLLECEGVSAAPQYGPLTPEGNRRLRHHAEYLKLFDFGDGITKLTMQLQYALAEKGARQSLMPIGQSLGSFEEFLNRSLNMDQRNLKVRAIGELILRNSPNEHNIQTLLDNVDRDEVDFFGYIAKQYRVLGLPNPAVYEKMFTPLNSIRRLNSAAEIDHFIDVGTQLVIRLKEDRAFFKSERVKSDLVNQREEGFTERRRNETTQRSAMFMVKYYPNLTQQGTPDFQRLHYRAIQACDSLAQVAHMCETKILPLNPLQRDVTAESQRQVLTKRYVVVIKAFRILTQSFWFFLDLLPQSALRSVTDLFDCLAGILSERPPEGADLEYHANLQNTLIVMRTGLFLPNLVGRCYFKYIVELSLEYYRQLVLDERQLTQQIRLGHSENMLHIAPCELAETMQVTRKAELLGQTCDQLQFVGKIDPNKLRIVNGDMIYQVNPSVSFNFTKRLRNGQRVVTLFRQWQDPDTSVVNWELFTMDYELYSRDQDDGFKDPDLGKYLVFQTDVSKFWFYNAHRESLSDLDNFFDHRLNNYARGNVIKQILAGELDRLLCGTQVTKESMYQNAFWSFLGVVDRLEIADAGCSTVLFCTHFEQVRRLIIQQNLLAQELRIKQFKFEDQYQDSFVTQQHNAMTGHPQYHHLPYVCLTFQQCESVRLLVLMARVNTYRTMYQLCNLKWQIQNFPLDCLLVANFGDYGNLKLDNMEPLLQPLIRLTHREDLNYLDPVVELLQDRIQPEEGRASQDPDRYRYNFLDDLAPDDPPVQEHQQNTIETTQNRVQIHVQNQIDLTADSTVQQPQLVLAPFANHKPHPLQQVFGRILPNQEAIVQEQLQVPQPQTSVIQTSQMQAIEQQNQRIPSPQYPVFNFENTASVQIVTYPSMSVQQPHSVHNPPLSISSGSSPFGLTSQHMSGLAQLSVEAQFSQQSSPFVTQQSLLSSPANAQLTYLNRLNVNNSAQLSHHVQSHSHTLMIPVGQSDSEVHYQEYNQSHTGTFPTTAESDQTFGNQLGKRLAPPLQQNPQNKRQNVQQSVQAQQQQVQPIDPFQLRTVQDVVHFVLTCKLHHRQLLKQKPRQPLLPSTNSYRQTYEVHWRIQLLTRLVQNVKANDPDIWIDISTLLVQTMQQLMASLQIETPQQLALTLNQLDAKAN